MKNLKKLSRNELKKLNGGKMVPDFAGDGWCGKSCDSCTYPARCMSCQSEGGKWGSHCQGQLKLFKLQFAIAFLKYVK